MIVAICFSLLKLLFNKQRSRIKSSFRAPALISQIIPQTLKKRSMYALDAGILFKIKENFLSLGSFNP